MSASVSDRHASAHLPECLVPWPRECICDRLRECEQRVYTLGIEVGKHDGWVAGHAAGVQAAREAVAALPYPRTFGDYKRDALAAIEVLIDGSE